MKNKQSSKSTTEFSFDWDEGNIKHAIEEHPERGNTIEEVESLFIDPYQRPQLNKKDPITDVQRFFTLAVGKQGIVKCVVFEFRNGKIRPITCYPANRKRRQQYYDLVTQIKRQSEEDS